MRIPTQQQRHAIELISTGVQIRNGMVDPTDSILEVVTYQHSRDGSDLVAHRTVLRDDATGNPRTDYRTEMFRISPDGTVKRI